MDTNPDDAWDDGDPHNEISEEHLPESAQFDEAPVRLPNRSTSSNKSCVPFSLVTFVRYFPLSRNPGYHVVPPFPLLLHYVVL